MNGKQLRRRREAASVGSWDVNSRPRNPSRDLFCDGSSCTEKHGLPQTWLKNMEEEPIFVPRLTSEKNKTSLLSSSFLRPELEHEREFKVFA